MTEREFDALVDELGTMAARFEAREALALGQTLRRAAAELVRLRLEVEELTNAPSVGE